MTHKKSTTGYRRVISALQGKTSFAVVVVLLVLGVCGSPWWMAAIGKHSAVNACQKAAKNRIGQTGSAAFTIDRVGPLPEWAGEWEVSGHADADRRYSYTCRIGNGHVLGLVVI